MIELKRDEDGSVWLQMRTPSNKYALINLTVMHGGQFPPIVQGVLDELVPPISQGKVGA